MHVISLMASALMFMPAETGVSVNKHPDPSSFDFSGAIANYRQILECEPLDYAMTAEVQLSGVLKRTYRMTSQSWSPSQLVQPSEWTHHVTLYIPDNAQRDLALFIVNNGIVHGRDGTGPVESTDFSAETLETIARNTKTAVVSLDNVPNQFLTYTDDGKARAEDDSVAHSWTLFMNAPEERATMPLHVPMAVSISRAMTLAEREIESLGIHRFIVSGISKRAWAAWLAGVVDSRTAALVPFALDMLNTRESLQHMYRSYGNNWPIAFHPYYAEEIDKKIDTPEFAKLMKVEDPLSYVGTSHEAQLSIPKYIINASGDDFFVPDNAKFYYDRLPGSTAMRMVPNSGHRDIRNSSMDSLTAIVNRLQGGTPLPKITTSLQGKGADQEILFASGEPPRKLLLWRAENPEARDFRYACDIRYTSTSVDPDTSRISVSQPEAGWSAYFVEATYADGFVATSPVYILGKNEYPLGAPPVRGNACGILPGRGLRP